MSLLTVEDLVIHFGRGSAVPVDGVSFSVDHDETLGLVGESGSGKTLSAMAVAGLLPDRARIERGRIRLGELDLLALDGDRGRRERARRIGVVFQNPTTALNPRLTVGTQLREALPELGRRAAGRRAVELLGDVGIPHPADRLLDYPHELSGGLAQRVVIALALAREPELLIADEPTTALDVTVQAGILDLIDRLRAERGLSVLLVSHDMAVIAQRAQRVVVLRHGVVEESGAVAAVLSAPSSDYTRDLIESVPRIDDGAPRSDAIADAPPIVSVTDLRRSFVIRRGFPGLAKRQDRVALDHVTFDVLPRQRVGIVGESGSGKSTLARAVVGLDRKYGGTVRYRGAAVKGLPRAQRRVWRRSVQFVFQDPYAALDPRIRVSASIAEPLRIQHGRRKDERERVLALLDEVGLARELADRLPGQLSGGQRQRVVIARALALDPDVLVADEAVSALDVSVQARILKLLHRLSEERGLTLLFISHDLAVIRELCDRTIVLRHGVVVEDRPTEDVFTAPAHPYTAELLAAAPRFPELAVH